jgi:hypothetical protein
VTCPERHYRGAVAGTTIATMQSAEVTRALLSGRQYPPGRRAGAVIERSSGRTISVAAGGVLVTV